MSIRVLPTEVLFKCFSYVPVPDIWQNVRGVCTQWRDIVDAHKGGWILKRNQNAIKVAIYYEQEWKRFGVITALRFESLTWNGAWFTHECFVKDKYLYFIGLPLMSQDGMVMDDFFSKNAQPFNFGPFQLHVKRVDYCHYILRFFYPLSSLVKIAATSNRICQWSDSEIPELFNLDGIDIVEQETFFSRAKCLY